MRMQFCYKKVKLYNQIIFRKINTAYGHRFLAKVHILQIERMNIEKKLAFILKNAYNGDEMSNVWIDSKSQY